MRFTFLSKKTPVAINDKCQIVCDTNGIIKEVNNNAIDLLLYEKHILLGQFVGFIMSPFMSHIHKNILLPKYNSANMLQRNIMHIFLSGKTMKRPLIVYDLYRKPIYVDLTVKLNAESMFVLEFKEVSDYANLSIYTDKLAMPNESFKLTQGNVVTISIQFRNSSRYITDHGVLKTIELHQKFHADLIDIIRRDFYPYISIYELNNQTVTLILNLDENRRMPRYCASLALCFLHNLYYLTAPYVTLQCGVTFDALYHGNIDNRLRFFGVAFELAAKFRDQCDENEICCSDDFIRKVTCEGVYTKDELGLYSRTFYIDGLKHQNSNFINITKLDPDKIISVPDKN
jgi:hypothetical protein